MYKNITIEAEHNEIILENSNGDKVIIPANKRNWVKQKLSEGCHDCIDSLVETLPVASQYAGDGSVYPPNKKVKVNQDNQIKEYDISSPEYRDLYNSGKLMSYDKNTDTYIATPLEEVIITGEAPQWVKDKRKYESQYTKDWYIDNIMPKFSRSMGVSADNMHPNNVKEYDSYINDKVVEDIFKRKPTFDTDYSNDRLKTLQGFSQKELELIKNSKYASKIEPSIWSKFEQGLLSVGNMGSPVQFKNPSLSQEEAKKEDIPLNILQPLSIPSKMVQSAYKKDYSFTDALKGKKNNAGIVEDIVTDPLNLVGLGIWGKLSKANKFKNLDEAYNVLNKTDDAVNNINRIKFDDFKNDNEFFRVIVGDEAFDDIVQTQKIRTKQPSSVKNTPPNTINLDRRGSTAFPSFSKGSPSLEYAKNNPNHYIIKTADESIKPSTSGRHGKGTTMFPTDKSGKHLTELDASKVQVYKHVGNGEYELVDVTKAGSKMLNKTDDVVKQAPKQLPGSGNVDDVGSLFKGTLTDKEKEMYRWFEKQQKLDALPKTTNKKTLGVLEDFKARIQTPEGKKRMKELGIDSDKMLQKIQIVEDPNTFGYFSGDRNRAVLNPLDPLPTQTARHEIEHGVQNAFQNQAIKNEGKIIPTLKRLVTDPLLKKPLPKSITDANTKIDDLLSGLELRKQGTPNKQWIGHVEQDSPVDISEYKSLISNKQNATDYFLTGSEGREKSAFLGEVQQYMMDNNIIPKTSYIEVTPEMVKNTFIEAMFDETGGGKYLRLFNIMKPSEANYKLISKGLNKMLGLIPPAAVIGTATQSQNQNKSEQ